MDDTKNGKLILKVKKDYPEFVDSVEHLQLKELEKTFSIYSQHREETLQAKENYQELNELKEKVKELSGPFNDTLKALKVKLAYMYLLIQKQKELKLPDSESVTLEESKTTVTKK